VSQVKKHGIEQKKPVFCEEKRVFCDDDLWRNMGQLLVTKKLREYRYMRYPSLSARGAQRQQCGAAIKHQWQLCGSSDPIGTPADPQQPQLMCRA